jgi:FkbM family methyltransferase
MRPDRAILTPAFAQLVADEPLVLIDIGARGDPEEPWALMDPAALRVVGFEPDREECERLSRKDPGRRYLPQAVWDETTDVDVHVAAHPGCTSVHPPNGPLLERYAPEHVRPRDTTAVMRYPARPLDEVLSDEGIVPDVVKIDTQGSEGEVIAGARETLRRHAFAVIVETWTIEVHQGQALTHDVMRALTGLGYSVFDVQVAAAWTRRSGMVGDLVAKRQVTGLDLLMLKDPVAEARTRDRVVWAGVADAFGFTDYALEILAPDSSAEAAAMRRAVIAGAAPVPRENGLRARLRRGGRRSVDRPFASLHS